jgi:6-phosphogluconolactonase (cycloisomerase 2 family)
MCCRRVPVLIDKGDDMKTFLIAIATVVAAIAAQAASAAQDTPGAVYTLTNAQSGNAVAYFSRSAQGALTYEGTFATGGNGTGGGLGSQRAVVLSDDGRDLYAVNAASNTVSKFAVEPNGLRLETQFPSGGIRPISVTVHGDVLYVLNAGSSTITGFTTAGLPLPGSTRALLGTGPAQVEFTPTGDALVVTEKASQTIDTFPVFAGIAQAGVSTPSAGATPFGFAFDNRGRLFVSEAGGSASSYDVSSTGASVISGAVPTHQGAPCWLVVSKNGKFAYTANAAAGSVSGFAIAPDGSLSLLGSTPGLVHPLDEAVSNNGRFLYVLNDGRHSIAGYRIEADGALGPLGNTGALPVSAIGLAAS